MPSSEFVLVVPLDASKIPDRSDASCVKVLLQGADGPIASQVVKLAADGKAEATFKLAEEPRGVEVIIGPETVADEELAGMQTLAAGVPSRAFATANRHVLHPVLIPVYHWYHWLRWCRKFTIRGVVTCADGSPVPGAKVCAQDIDTWWWWTSRQEVGCATTDVNGAFEINFTWCCGYWPWWWFARRLWRIDPHVSERIHTVLAKDPQIGPIPTPDPTPDFAVFDQLLARGPAAAPMEGPIADPSDLAILRPQLLEKLPVRPELDALKIWPWHPWQPWADCTPDIIFHVTQDYGQGEKVIVDEGYFDTRWNIPTTLDVSLVANDEAVCISRPPQCPEPGCITFSKVCEGLVTSIGGNLGAPGPEGYYSGDRPYAGVVSVKGTCADWIDYYEVEIAPVDPVTGTGPHQPLPADAIAGYTLYHFDFSAPVPTFTPVSFPVQSIGGRNVIETLGHWEFVNGPRFWVSDRTMLFHWLTTKPSPTSTGPTANFSDGTYSLQLHAYKLSAPNTLTDLGVPHQCNQTPHVDNELTLTIDNRLVGPASGHVSVAGHDCAGGVHVCTTEPDTDFVSVRLDGAPLDACAHVARNLADPDAELEIRFLAHDPNGHLSHYHLEAYWGENQVRNLLGQPSSRLERVTADQVGPSYGAALSGSATHGLGNIPAATAPVWHGGEIILRVKVLEAFPEPCCYLLDLWAYKRTIDGCNYDYPHRNRSTFTLTVT